MLEKLLLAITVTFLAYLSVEPNGYNPALMSSEGKLPAATVVNYEAVALIKGNN